MIYVTHDQVEAMTLADRIVVLRAGRIEQVGTPLDVYNHPANLFVAGFIGSPRMNLFSGRVIDMGQVTVGSDARPISVPRPAMLLREVTSRWGHGRSILKSLMRPRRISSSPSTWSSSSAAKPTCTGRLPACRR